MNNLIYFVAIVTVWVIVLTFVFDFEIAITVTAVFFALGLIGKLGSRALEDWLRGRNARKTDELQARLNERLSVVTRETDRTTDGTENYLVSPVLIKSDLCGYYSATVDSILKLPNESVSKGDLLAILLVETKSDPLRLRVLSTANGKIKRVAIFERNEVKNGSVLFEISPK